MNGINTNTFAPDHSYLKKGSYTLPQLSEKDKVVVIGAGAFGGWTALFLLEKGYNVTLIDAWGAGNARSSSGDETRVIRSTYGSNQLYFDLNVRALSLWKTYQQKFNKSLFYNTGVLWFCYDKYTAIVDDSVPYAASHQLQYELLSREELKKKYKLINTEDLHHAYFDSSGGYLMAREACRSVKETFCQLGGRFIQAHVKSGPTTSGKLNHIYLSDNTKMEADLFLFACGAWMGKVFPGVLQHVITCTKQEVYYFGVPERLSLQFDSLPVWIDVDNKDFYYGIAGNGGRGFKVGVDIRGERFDPSTDHRTMNAETFQKARVFIEHRFPALKDAPLIENRVCPYENSPDGNFVVDVHPEAGNVLLIGGGSGHGFKHGPALAEWISDALITGRELPSLFSLKKFDDL